MYKVNNTLTSAYGDMDLPKKQGPVRILFKVFVIAIQRQNWTESDAKK